MASKREIESRTRRAARLVKTCLRAWEGKSLDDLPEKARVALLAEAERIRTDSGRIAF
jgi:hypothetical protein